MLTEKKKEFIEFMMESDVLRFGDFVTKSGRNTPYFVNTGNFRTGKQIATLGKFYAALIKENCGDNFPSCNCRRRCTLQRIQNRQALFLQQKRRKRPR